MIRLGRMVQACGAAAQPYALVALAGNRVMPSGQSAPYRFGACRGALAWRRRHNGAHQNGMSKIGAGRVTAGGQRRLTSGTKPRRGFWHWPACRMVYAAAPAGRHGGIWHGKSGRDRVCVSHMGQSVAYAGLGHRKTDRPQDGECTRTRSAPAAYRRAAEWGRCGATKAHMWRHVPLHPGPNARTAT